MEYYADKADSAKLVHTTSTTYDREGNASVIVSRSFPDHGYDSTAITFDSVGNILQAIEYDSSGSIKGSETHTFDHRGNLLGSRYLDKAGDPRYTETFIYDGHGRVTQETSWDIYWPGHTRTRSYAYDSLGYCIRDSSEDEIAEITFDNNHTVTTERKIRNSDTSWSVFHDSNDALLKSHTVETDGKVEFRDHQLYDGVGRLVELRSEDVSLKNLTVLRYVYDEKGKTSTGTTTDSLGVVKARSVRRFNTKNDLLESVDYDGSGNVKDRVTNTFDKRGNIILRERLTTGESENGEYQWHFFWRWTYQYYE